MTRPEALDKCIKLFLLSQDTSTTRDERSAAAEKLIEIRNEHGISMNEVVDGAQAGQSSGEGR